MVLTHTHLGRQVTEYVVLLLIVSAHAFSLAHPACGFGVLFQQPARNSLKNPENDLLLFQQDMRFKEKGK
jgi:hypothetical protein